MDVERDETPMPSDLRRQPSDEIQDSPGDKSSWTRSASDCGASFPDNRNVGHTSPLRSERRITSVQMSGPLDEATQGRFRRTSDTKFHNALYGDAKGWAKNFWSFLQTCRPGVMNPDAKSVQRWNKLFVISCLVAIFVDPLFLFLLSFSEDSKCIVIQEGPANMMLIFRTITDVMYILHVFLQIKLACVSPESRLVDAGDLVDHPRKISLVGLLLIDLFVLLPIPQVVILIALPRVQATSIYAKNLLWLVIFLQYLPRLYRFLPVLAGQSPIGFIFESAWANFVLNLLTFVLSGHVVGSAWYLFGLQRVNHCLRDACRNSRIDSCMEFFYCGHGTTGEQKGKTRRR